MTYKAVFIDWDGTLSVSKFWQQWATTKPEALSKVQSTLFIDNMALVNQWMRGQRTAEDCLQAIAPTVDLSFIELFDALQQSCQNMSFISATIVPQIQALRQQGIKVVIATDNMDTFPRWTIPALQLDEIFDDILNSNRLGFFKSDILPDKSSAFFGPYLASHHLNPQDCLLIDDSPTNQLVKNVGLNVLTITRGQDITPVLANLNK